MKEKNLSEFLEESITEDQVLSVTEQIALSDQNLRERISKTILKLFICTNITVLLFLVVLLIKDWTMLANGVCKVSDRIINSSVVMTLIGATTVQLGTIMVTISNYIFRKN